MVHVYSYLTTVLQHTTFKSIYAYTYVDGYMYVATVIVNYSLIYVVNSTRMLFKFTAFSMKLG